MRIPAVLFSPLAQRYGHYFRLTGLPIRDFNPAMAGIVSYGSYVPYRRLKRAAIGQVLGVAAGKGERAVASFDETDETIAQLLASLDSALAETPKLATA